MGFCNRWRQVVENIELKIGTENSEKDKSLETGFRGRYRQKIA